MPNTRKVELSLWDVDTLELALTRFMGAVKEQKPLTGESHVGATYEQTELEELRQRLLEVGDDIYEATARP